jgi:hypothetical protein
MMGPIVPGDVGKPVVSPSFGWRHFRFVARSPANLRLHAALDGDARHAQHVGDFAFLQAGSVIFK